MTRLVVDASVAAKWLIDEEGTEAALRLRDPAYDLVGPDLLFLEVGSVVWRKVHRGEIDGDDGRAMVAAILDAPLRVELSSALLPLAWEIAVAHDRSVYDGVYLALAVAIDAPLVTADRRLARAMASTGLADRVVEIKDLPLPR
ncbi:MAG: type II toxin-antitoxin system VapC family toxin [Gemmatimonadota bacterium]|nr:type II toxin-antitoxin system VapC family toxin [Gemmatimonadota bacterium]